MKKIYLKKDDGFLFAESGGFETVRPYPIGSADEALELMKACCIEGATIDETMAKQIGETLRAMKAGRIVVQVQDDGTVAWGFNYDETISELAMRGLLRNDQLFRESKQPVKKGSKKNEAK